MCSADDLVFNVESDQNNSCFHLNVFLSLVHLLSHKMGNGSITSIIEMKRVPNTVRHRLKSEFREQVSTY